MKLTKRQLTRLIKEELEAVLNEQVPGQTVFTKGHSGWKKRKASDDSMAAQEFWKRDMRGVPQYQGMEGEKVNTKPGDSPGSWTIPTFWRLNTGHARLNADGTTAMDEDGKPIIIWDTTTPPKKGNPPRNYTDIDQVSDKVMP
jgi:hypothetical protein